MFCFQRAQKCQDTVGIFCQTYRFELKFGVQVILSTYSILSMWAVVMVMNWSTGHVAGKINSSVTLKKNLQIIWKEKSSQSSFNVHVTFGSQEITSEI